MRKYFKVNILLLFHLVLVSCTPVNNNNNQVDKQQTSSSSVANTQSGPVNKPNGPESRQITAPAAAAVANSPTSNVYSAALQNAVYNQVLKAQNSPASSSSSNSFFSFLRPSQQGGRRESFTSRLRNFWNNLFYRREQSPFQAAGSSYSYAFRAPPYGYNPIAQYGSYSSNNNIFGSPLTSQNLYGSASQIRPVLYPSSNSSPSLGSSLWSGYKQWASALNSGASSSSINSPISSANTANYAWSPPASSNGFTGLSSSGSSGISSVGGYPVGSSSQYQASGSNSYPSAAAYSYNKRSSSNLKPSAAYQSGSSSSIVSDTSVNNNYSNKPNAAANLI